MWTAIWSIAAGIPILAADVLTPLGLAAGVAYVVLVSVLRSPSRRQSFLVAGAYSGFVGLGFLFSPAAPYVSEWMVYSNRVLSVGAIWICAALKSGGSEYRRSLESLSARVLSEQDAQRRNTATEIHDSVGQISAGLSLILQKHRSQLRRDGLAADLPAVDTAIGLADEITAEARNLAMRLFPAVLSSRGLAGALQSHIDELHRRHGVEIELRAEALPALPDEIKLCFFRVTQECLTNVMKHAAARHAWVRLESQEGRVRLWIRDDGDGAEPEVVRAFNAGRGSLGFGLYGVLERIREAGGEASMQADGGGTTVRVSVPLPKNVGDERERVQSEA